MSYATVLVRAAYLELACTIGGIPRDDDIMERVTKDAYTNGLQ